MDEHEVRGHAFLNAPGVIVPEQLAAGSRRGDQRLTRGRSGGDQQLDLPGQLARANGASAEVRPGGDADTRAPRSGNRGVRALLAIPDPPAALFRRETFDR